MRDLFTALCSLYILLGLLILMCAFLSLADATAADAAAAAAAASASANRRVQFRWGSRRRSASSVQHGQWRQHRRPTRS